MNDLYQIPEGIESRWASAENPRGEKGQGGASNGTRKGKASLPLLAGTSATLAEEPAGTSGTIRRIWITIETRTPKMLRGIRIEAFWDGAERPAISAPIGDFFGIGLGKMLPFENAFFSNPEGRSFNCRLPMPFKNGMRIVATNDSDTDITMFFYDVDYTVGEKHDADTLYLHAHFRRENPTTLQKDYEMLPKVTGRGRFLGVNIGVLADTERYGRAWWGEGEVKIYQDGDTDLPTLCGTGTEDYIGTAWGQGVYAHTYQGCPIADHANMAYCFYRYHVPDPIWFQEDCRVTIQQIGGCNNEEKRWLLERIRTSGDPVYVAGPGLVPVDLNADLSRFLMFEREDDWSSCAYFYLDRPESELPLIAPFAERVAGL